MTLGGHPLQIQNDMWVARLCLLTDRHDELTDAISKSHDTAVGPDDVHYQMLKHLPDDALLTLLNILNNIWASGKFPTSWCTSTVIPVPKPGKDTSDPSNYRPIALTVAFARSWSA